MTDRKVEDAEVDDWEKNAQLAHHEYSDLLSPDDTLRLIAEVRQRVEKYRELRKAVLDYSNALAERKDEIEAWEDMREVAGIDYSEHTGSYY